MSFQLQASYIAKAHTLFASAAFLGALLIGTRLHYRKIVKNDVAGYPEEWWPSVSATIGDWYPERSIFQILIALTSGPRFALVFCWWLITNSTRSTLPFVVALSGIARTFCCGGWVYITSSDDHDTHDFLMIAYICLNLPWMMGSILCTPDASSLSKNRRKIVAGLFFGTLAPLIYFFIEHKIRRIPGAYTYYSFCEWFLIVTDIWFDSITAYEFSKLEISISSSGKRHLVPNSNIMPSVVTPSPTSYLVKPSQKVRTRDLTSGTMTASILGAFKLPFIPTTSLRESVSFFADLYLSYVWWSILTVLIPSLFYFSVWELSIAGQEISLLSLLSPILLAYSPVSSKLYTPMAKISLQGVCVLGLGAYMIPAPLGRLFVIAVANVSGSLIRAIEWSESSDAFRQGTVLILGLMASSLSKFLNHTVNPVWTIADSTSGGWNKLGILLALFSFLDYARRLQEASTGGVKDMAVDKTADKGIPSTDMGLWLSAVGLGSLLFSLHRFLADADTLIAYTWTGYPIKGPLPGAHGHLTLLAMGLGLIVSTTRMKTLVYHPMWITIGLFSAYILLKWKNWPGYVAGLTLAGFLSSLAPNVLSLASLYGRYYPAKVYATVWATVCLFYLADVWTVAYAFVPAGWLLRERTDVVVAAQMAGVSFGLVSAWRRAHWLSGCSQTATTSFNRQVYRALGIFSVLAMISVASRLPGKVPIPHHADHRLFTAGIWTVHFGIDDAGRDSQYRMRDLIKDMELDVVGLLETDVHRIVFGNRDLTRVIAEDLGYYVDIGPGPPLHTWGAVLLSKFPILSSTHHLLPSPHGELAPAISAVLDIWGQNVTVVVAHNGQEEDPLDRELQSKELAHIMSSIYPDPVVFLGYVVTKPHAERPNPYQILVEDGLVHDIDDEDWDRWCEYIFYRGLYRVAFARVSRSTITDTELQIGKFVVPKPGHPVINATREERYLRNFRENLPSSMMWFPDDFLQAVNPNGVRGHYYHVNPWPLYYMLPDNAIV